MDNERDLRAPTDETMAWLASLPTSKLVNVLRDAGRISHRPEDSSMLAQLIERIRVRVPEANAPWIPVGDGRWAGRPREGSYLVANAKGQVAPWIRGVIHNNAGSPWDWEYGEAITHWMELPSPPPQNGRL